uniref:Uncharacterized protein n=1 Tax=Rhizophagus irregularis (strain DAOM 181602 / DAOM 197198 / MUCL 43194) TaxID=747089 RepID=U9U5H2_RHIID
MISETLMLSVSDIKLAKPLFNKSHSTVVLLRLQKFCSFQQVNKQEVNWINITSIL